MKKLGMDEKDIPKMVKARRQFIGLGEAINLYHRGIINYNEYLDLAQKIGFDPEHAKMGLETSYQLLEPSGIIEAHIRGLLDDEQFTQYLKKHGFKEEDINLVKEINLKLIPEDILLRLYFRKIIDEGEFKKRMKKLGWKEEDIPNIVEASKFYPGPADTIHFIAREVFEPDMIEKLGLLDEFDKINLEPLRKAGVPDEISKWYWIAHWEHPDWYRIREMFHRGLISEDMVREWFRIIEIPPFWRDKYLQILYEIPTRVDVRRMVRDGIIPFSATYEGIPDSVDQIDIEKERRSNSAIGYYLKMGYKPE
ncbi:MAG: hypothetical protein ACTSQ8_24775, partial [Candidatus Helarchaeota archaeon]